MNDPTRSLRRAGSLRDSATHGRLGFLALSLALVAGCSTASALSGGRSPAGVPLIGQWVKDWTGNRSRILPIEVAQYNGGECLYAAIAMWSNYQRKWGLPTFVATNSYPAVETNNLNLPASDLDNERIGFAFYSDFLDNSLGGTGRWLGKALPGGKYTYEAIDSLDEKIYANMLTSSDTVPRVQVSTASWQPVVQPSMIGVNGPNPGQQNPLSHHIELAISMRWHATESVPTLVRVVDPNKVPDPNYKDGFANSLYSWDVDGLRDRPGGYRTNLWHSWITKATGGCTCGYAGIYEATSSNRIEWQPGPVPQTGSNERYD